MRRDMEERMLEIWEPLDHYRLSSEMKDAQEAPSEQYARLKWKVARDFCRYNWKWPFTAYGPTFNVISPVQQKTRSQYAKVERRLCRIATRVYVVAATKRVTSNCGCAALKVETVGQALHGGGIPRHFHESKRNSSLKGNRFIPIDTYLSRWESVLQHPRSVMIILLSCIPRVFRFPLL